MNARKISIGSFNYKGEEVSTTGRYLLCNPKIEEYAAMCLENKDIRILTSTWAPMDCIYYSPDVLCKIEEPYSFTFEKNTVTVYAHLKFY